MKNIAVLSIVVILTMIWLIVSKTQERYTDSDLDKLLSPLRGSNVNERQYYHYVSNTVFSELNDDRTSELSNINSLIDLLNTGRSNTFAHYSTVDELNSMYDQAYSSTEANLSTRDKMILRCITSTSRIKPPFPITYTSEGVPDWTSMLIAESGKTTKEMLMYCFTILIKLHNPNATNIQSAYTPEFFDYLNSTIPDKYSPKFDRNDPFSLMNAMQMPNPDEKTTWFWKAISIGPAYLAWLAENKWRLDLTWTP